MVRKRSHKCFVNSNYIRIILKMEEKKERKNKELLVFKYSNFGRFLILYISILIRVNF